jgi:hypothetical protein
MTMLTTGISLWLAGFYLRNIVSMNSRDVDLTQAGFQLNDFYIDTGKMRME